MTEEKTLTGYPSIDKPWLKYYSENEIRAQLPKSTLFQSIWDNNKGHLGDIALRYYGTAITYKTLFENIKKAASFFYYMGIRAGDVITIMSMQTPETIYAIYGLNYIGAISNIVYMTLSENEIVDKVTQTSSKALLILDVALERYRSLQQHLAVPIIEVSVSDSMPHLLHIIYNVKKRKTVMNVLQFKKQLKKKYAEPQVFSDHSAPAVIVYTSGSTGEPKGVVLTNDSMNAHASQETNKMYSIRRGRKLLLILPPFVGFGITKLHVAINAGLDISLWIDLQPEAIVNAFFKINPEMFVAGPALVDTFLRHKPRKLSRLKIFVGGGGEISEEKEQEFNSFLRSCQTDCIYANGYGMTEAGSTLCGSSNTIHKIRSVGIPLVKTNVKVVDMENGELLPYNEVGELCFSTPDLMLGYYNDKEATERVIVTDSDGIKWIRTGDLGCVDEDGFIYIKGRIKRIYVTLGEDGNAYKLFPLRIEKTLASSPYVEQSAVVAKEIETSIFTPIAFITLKDKSLDHSIIIEKLQVLCEEELSSHERPNLIMVIDSMPFTPSGKTDYRALEKIVREGPNAH